MQVNDNNSNSSKIIGSQGMRRQVHEAYNLVRANIIFALNNKKCRRILVTSPSEKDKRVETASNLAISFSQQPATKVLLIDCDYRQPKGKAAGIYNYFYGEGTLKPLSSHSLYHCEEFDEILYVEDSNFYIICAEGHPSNPSALFTDEQFWNLLSQFEDSVDYMIINAPPVNNTSDALLLAAKCDGVILPVVKNKTRHNDIRSAVDLFARLNINVLGFVLHAK